MMHWFRASAVVGVSLLVGCARQDPPPPDRTEGRQQHPDIGSTAEAITSPPPNTQFVALAERSFFLEQNALVHGGSVGARATSTTGALFAGSTGSVQQNGFDTSQSIYADYLTLQQNALVGPISTDHLVSQLNAAHGTLTAFLQPPALPTLQPVTPGSTAITVAAGQTVTKASGSYGAVTVSQNATLKLSGGIYQVSSLTVQANAQVQVLAPTQLRVLGRVGISSNTFVGPTTASGLSAGAFRVEVSGTNGGTGAATSTPHAFDIILNSTFKGLILAPNGSVFVEGNATVLGAIAAKDIDVSQNGVLNWQDGLGGITCAGSCDDSNPCTTDACSNGSCTHAAVTNGTACDDGAVCTQGDSCQAGVCTGTVSSAGTVCRASTGACDPAETCSGSSGACPADSLAPATTVCRSAAGSCDVAEMCTGSSAACPADAFSPSSTVCRASIGSCDVAESCSGTAATCPADAFASAGTSCRAGAGACDTAEVCTGSSGSCPADTFVAAGTVCRASAGVCDVAEVCTGSTSACPSDSRATAGTVCRGSTGVCDVAEACDGTNVACPSDHYAVAGTTCRASAGSCDVAEACTGSGPSCPADSFASSATTCRPSAGACDSAESCTGSSASCPADTLVSAGTTCRASAGPCDVAEACSGSSSACPSDAHVAAGTVCRASGGSCDLAESCDGSTSACPADHFAGAGTTCRASAGPCDVAEACSGASASCPSDAFASAGTNCRPAAGACDLAEACTGAGSSCPTDAKVAAGTTCRAASGVCDVAESCDGSTDNCPTDSFTSAGTVCRAAVTGGCDVAETCSGAAGACPADGTVAAGTVCRPSAGACDVAEVCTGASTCPADGFASSSIVCRAANGACDVAEHCTGAASACPADQSAANGTSCSDGDACTQTDSCQNGACTGSNPVSCTVADQCHIAGVCDSATGHCSNPAKSDGATCSDGNACTQSDTCQSGLCTGANPVTCSASDSCHLAGTCNTATGTCSNPSAPNGATCSDGNACTQSDSCQSGTCVGSNPVTCGPPDQCHTAGACDSATGVCSNPAKADGTACDDGAPCTQSDACHAGACSGALVASGTVCRASTGACDTAETCDGASGACPTDHLATAGTVCRAAAGACDVGETCTGTSAACPADVLVASGTTCRSAAGSCDVAEVCTGSTGSCPSDAKVAAGTTCRAASGTCDVAESCDGASGACPDDAFATAGVVCRAAAAGGCDVAEACSGSSGACPSDAFATAGTTCRATAGPCDVAESCTGSSVSCPSDSFAGSSTICRPAAGACDVAEHCSGAASACPADQLASNGTACSDGDACTRSDTCQNGSCTGANPVVCTASDQCHAVGTCNSATGVCSNPVAANGASCSDGNSCTQTDSCQNGACTGSNPVSCSASDQCHLAGVCDTATGTCSNPAATNGTSCNDGNACTQTDACQSGTCTGTNPTTCSASDQCHVAGTCNPTTGACSNPAASNGTSCSDGNACTQTDTCQTGVCTGSNPVSCAASDACHVAGTCNAATGACTNPLAGDGTSCSDGSSCTQTDSCQSGTCVGSNPVTCAASDQCHVAGVCDAASGHCSNPPAANGTTCSDGNACTQSDSCQSGSCVGASPVSCTASDACHAAGTCDPATGACSNPAAPNGTSCSDGNACTQSDTCQNGACSGANPVTCTASDPCHIAGACDPATGSCSNPAAADGSACSDGDACTPSDSCHSGVCSGGNPVTCTASDQCHAAGTCNPATGACTNPVSTGASCDDGNACTYTDTCSASGSCAGTSITCGSTDPCLQRSCNGTSTCATTNSAQGTPCSGSACTGSNVCNGSGVCACEIVIPPDPATVAPPLDRTVATTLYAMTSFLFQGTSPTQTAVSPTAIDPLRIAVCRGRVTDAGGAPLPGVVVTVLGHPELGQTVSRTDGVFDIASNGGGEVVFELRKTGLLPVQRKVVTTPQEFCTVPLAAMIERDPQVTSVTLDGSGACQVARGTQVVDASGTRTATVVFPPGVTASMVMPDGTTDPLPIGSIRATEYTVGPNGQSRMPGDLPAQSAYTYAAELSADEAVAAGASGVRFDEPVSLYVDNFLGFKTGAAVPNGFYDRTGGSGYCGGKGCWIPQTNGRVVAVLSTSGGVATVDYTGDGAADDPAAIGITSCELQQLAALYAPGQSVWRVPTKHFSVIDNNWPFEPPQGAIRITAPLPVTDDPDSGAAGDFVGCKGQDVGKTLPLQGTTLCLDYQSGRSPGRIGATTVRIPLTDGTIPVSPPNRIEVTIEIAGQKTLQTFAFAPNLTTTYTWDGRDVYGRKLQGAQPITVTIAFPYNAFCGYEDRYADLVSFALSIGEDPTTFPARPEFFYTRTWKSRVGGWDESATGLGGWSLCGHNAFNPVASTLYLGDGSRRGVDVLPPILRWIGGNDVDGNLVEEESAKKFDVHVGRVAVGPDGSVFVADYASRTVQRISPDGVIHIFAGVLTIDGSTGYSGDGGPATSAQIGIPDDVAVASDGTVLISDHDNRVVRKVDLNGIITTVAGVAGAPCDHDGDGGPAALAHLCGDTGYQLAAGPDCSFYLVDGPYVRRVGADGTINAFAGSLVVGSVGGENGPARDAIFANPRDVAVGPDGTVYIADSSENVVWQVGIDGILRAAAGSFAAASPDDGVLATTSLVYSPLAVAVANDGTLYIAEYQGRIRRVTGDGIITTIVGGGVVPGLPYDVVSARLAQVAPSTVDVGPDGSLFLGDDSGGVRRVYRVTPVLPTLSLSESVIASEDGTELFVFDSAGRHLRTLDALTAGIKRQFVYDAQGRVSAAIDGTGNATTIRRDSAGNVTSIVSPYGDVTSVATDANGFLSSVTDPDGRSVSMSYGPTGLLASFADAAGNQQSFSYDDAGRVIQVVDALGGKETLARTDSATGFTVARTTNLQRASSVIVDAQPAGRVTTGLAADGTSTVQIEGLDGSRSVTLASGMTSTEVFNPDPRFGMESAFPASLILATPGGLTLTETRTRATTLADPTNLLSNTDQTDVATVNGQTYTTSYSRGAGTVAALSPMGRQLTLSVDSQSRFAGVSIPGVAPLAVTYDGLGRVASMSQGANAYTRTYDARGNLASISNPLGDILAFLSYQGPNRPTMIGLPGGASLGFGYDGNGNVTSLTPPGKPEHRMAYTGLNTLLAYVPPDGQGTGRAQYAYNADHQLVQVTRLDGSTVDVAYQTSGQLASFHQPRGTTTFGFSATTGQLTSIASPDGGTLAYAYDGELLTSSTWSGPVAGDVSRVYDSNFRVVSETVSGGSPVGYDYDGDGLTITAGAMSLAYDPQNGLLAGTTVGSTTDVLGYDGLGAVSSYDSSNGSSALYSYSQTRNGVGRIISSTETVQGTTHARAFSYDAEGRLTAVTVDGSASASFVYDPNGNRVSITDSSGGRSATFDTQDRITAQGTATFAHAPDGERLSRTDTSGVTTYGYDAFGSLVSATLSNGTAVSYVLDGKGRRVGKRVAGNLVQGFLYSSPGRVVAELDAGGAVVRRFVYATEGNTPDYFVQGGATYRIISDAVGSPRLVVEASTGAVVQRMAYDSFGVVVEDTSPGTQPFGFAGGIYDQDTKLVRFGARDYDPETGRFTTKDPLGFRSGGANLYGYAFSDPVNLTDPSGLDVGGPERVGGLPFSVGRLASYAYGEYRAWRRSGVLMGGARNRSGGGLDLALVNLSGEQVGLAPYRPLPNRTESCARIELDAGMAKSQWSGFRTCTSCTFTDDLLSRCLLPVPAVAEISGLPPCEAGAADAIGGGTAAPPSPTGGIAVAKLASASSNPVTGVSTTLTALGFDPNGESGLTYTWSTIGTPPAGVTFAPSGTNAAKSTTATFSAPGSYSLQVTIANAGGDTTVSTATVLVESAPTMLSVTPPTSTVGIHGTELLFATVLDQFGSPVMPPPVVAWSASGGGVVDATGLFHAGGIPGGPYTVQAAVGSLTAQAGVSITNASPVVVVAPTSSPNPVTGTTSTLSVLGADDGGEENLLYGWFDPQSLTTFSPNRTLDAKNATAHFLATGTYPLSVQIRDPFGGFVESTFSVTVVPTYSSLSVSPAVAAVPVNGTQAFEAVGLDQFHALGVVSGATWAVSGGGTIGSDGVFHAGSAFGGPFTVTATLGSRTASASVTVDSVPPTLTAGPTATPNPVTGTTTALSVLGSDASGEANLTYQWSVVSGPPGAVIAPNGSNAAKNSNATFSRAGSYVLQATATNTANESASGTVNVTVSSTVAAVNTAPTASSSVGDSLVVSATATDQFGAHVTDGVTFAWTKVSGAGTVTFMDAGAASTSAQFSAPGTYVLQVSATGGGSTKTATTTVTVTPKNNAPVVSMGPGATIKLPTNHVTLSGSATDDGQPAGGSLSYKWSLASGPNVVSFSSASPSTTATFIDPGTYVLALTASDGKLTGSGSVEVVVQPEDGATPVVSLTSPADGSEITKPTDIMGNVTGGSWKLEYRLGGDGTDNWVTFASGTGAASGKLATFDPTLRLNGNYGVRLRATTAEGTTTADFSASVTRNMKVGYFTLAFTDLQVPVSGLPITIVRRYDSRDKKVGDFGFGWTLDIKNVRVESSRIAGVQWNQTATPDDFPTYCLESAKSHDVTVTFSSNRVYRFSANPAACSFLQPIPDGTLSFDPVAPTLGTLTPLDGASFMVHPGDPGTLVDLETLEPINPQKYLLETEDGTKWTLEKDKGVEAMVDRVGNTLLINDSGIHHSSGREVLFERDSKGRITTITDPNGKPMKYAYDDAGNLSTFTDRVQASSTFTYQDDHLLLDYTDANGHRAVRNDYDPSGRLLSQTDANGKSITYAADVSAKNELVTDRLGHSTFFEYDDHGNVTRVTDALGGVKTMTYDDRDNKLSETDQLGHTTSYVYDIKDNVATTTDPLGHVTTQGWNGFRQLLVATDPLGHTRSMIYDPSTLLMLQSRDALGKLTNYTYDVFTGNRVSMTDPLGHTTHYAYDGDGRMTKMTDPLGHDTLYTYDANGRRLTETSTRTTTGGLQTLVTTTTYDDTGRVTRVTYPDGTSTQTTFTPSGKRESTIDELGHVTAFAYDDQDRLTMTTYPDGTSTLSTYDDEGRVVARRDQAARTTVFVFDELGRQTTTTYADGTSTSGGYDAAGRGISQTNENGHTSRTVYDNAGRRTASIDGLGHATTVVYDDAGRQTDTIDANAHGTHTTYDAEGRVTKTTFADGASRQKSYDDAGRLVTETDELGHVTTRHYDDAGRLTSVEDALGHATSYAYDELGQLTQQLDANLHATHFAHDARGRQTSRTLADGAVETKQYDDAGRVSTRVDFLGRTTVYGEDVLGRVTSRTYPDGTGVVLTYTSTGRRKTMADARGVTTYEYDLRDRVTQLTYPDGRYLSYSYDAAGNRSSLGAHVGTTDKTTSYGYDAAERPTMVTDPEGGLFEATHDAVGLLTALSYPNGTNTTYAYDVRNRSTNIATTLTATSATIQSYGLTMDLAGNRTHIDEADGTSRTFGYDDLYRLTTEDVSGGAGPNYGKAFGYDPVGNRLSQVTTGFGAATVTYSYDNRDRLTGEGAATYSSDANGSVTGKSGEATYAWDFENRLVRVTRADGTVVAHDYDPDGTRVRTKVTPPSATTVSMDYLVDTVSGFSEVVADSSSGSVSAAYVRVGPELLAVVRPSVGGWTPTFVHHDAIDSVRALTDSSGVVVDARSFEAYGDRYSETGDDPLVFGFAGEAFEAGSRLAYHRARWMDPKSGRFISMDPMPGDPAIGASWHRYEYARCSPPNLVDPTGFVSLGQGFQVHSYIGIDFEASILVGNRKANYFKFLNLLDIDGDGGSLKPDLIDLAAYAIWEIKTHKGQSKGKKQLENYLAIVQAAFPLDGWHEGTAEEYSPPRRFAIAGGVAVVDLPVKGLILYEVEPTGGPLGPIPVPVPSTEDDREVDLFRVRLISGVASLVLLTEIAAANASLGAAF